MNRNSIIKNIFSNTFNSKFNSQHICTNCGVKGHSFKQCIAPVLSYGFLIFRFPNPDWTLNKNLCSAGNVINGTDFGGKPEVLMIRRKDSFRFVEFIRGKYDINDIEYLQQLFAHITIAERDLILTKEFPELWQHVWGTSNPKNYRNDFEQSQIKFNELKSLPGKTEGKSVLQELIEEAPVLWSEPEWGFPKGRRNSGTESDIDCSIRETYEETGFNQSHYDIIETIDPLCETFYGDNKIHYCHKYFLAISKNNAVIQFNTSNPHMAREIGDIRWVPVDDAINLIRPENVEKREVLLRAITIIRNLCPFSHGRLFFTRP
jgi:8-oxo-dGTP pyrophosphatase MutT (NUDIX family)